MTPRTEVKDEVFWSDEIWACKNGEQSVADLEQKILHQIQKTREEEAERIKAFHDEQSIKGDCVANSEGQRCCVDEYIQRAELDQDKK